MDKVPYLSTKEVEQIYGLTEKLQTHLRHVRKLTYTKIGRRCVYKTEWVEEYINRNTVRAAG